MLVQASCITLGGRQILGNDWQWGKGKRYVLFLCGTKKSRDGQDALACLLTLVLLVLEGQQLLNLLGMGVSLLGELLVRDLGGLGGLLCLHQLMLLQAAENFATEV